MKLSYAICVCDEARELKTLLEFINTASRTKKTKLLFL